MSHAYQLICIFNTNPIKILTCTVGGTDQVLLLFRRKRKSQEWTGQMGETRKVESLMEQSWNIKPEQLRQDGTLLKQVIIPMRSQRLQKGGHPKTDARLMRKCASAEPWGTCGLCKKLRYHTRWQEAINTISQNMRLCSKEILLLNIKVKTKSPKSYYRIFS